MRRAFVLALFVVLAGCAAPVPGTTVTDGSGLQSAVRDDPATDTLGWEAGYWADESIGVEVADGLNATERNATIARTMARVEAIRHVEFDEPVQVDVISRKTYREEFSGGGNASSSGALRAFDNAKFEALFLVGERGDSMQSQAENRGSSVLGFYSPAQDRIVVISESETPTLDEVTLAHELVHAYQFRHFDPTYESRTRDESNAQRGLIEGDARYVDQQYRDRCDNGWTCVKPPATGGSSGSGGGSLHMGIYLMSYFPYSDGPGFVTHFYEQGGWDRVNDLYADPPESAEQVAVPAKYGTDPPVDVSLPDRSSAAWDRVTVKGRAPYGEVGISGLTAMFAYPAYETSRDDVAPESYVMSDREFLNYRGNSVNPTDPIDYTAPLVDGWEGDKLYVYENDVGEIGYVWRLKWESEDDAREFAAGYRDLLRYWGGDRVAEGRWRIPEGESEFADAFAVQVEGDTVTIVNAPSREDLSGIRQGVDG